MFPFLFSFGFAICWENNNKNDFVLDQNALYFFGPKCPLMPKTQTGQKGGQGRGVARRGCRLFGTVGQFFRFGSHFFVVVFGSLPLPAAVYHNFVDLLSANSTNNKNNNKNNNNNAKKSNNRAEENQKRGAPERRQRAMAPKKLLPAAQKTLPNKI